MNALEHFEWNSNLIASVFQNCTWIRLSKVNFRIFPKWCMCCDVAGTLNNIKQISNKLDVLFLWKLHSPVQKLAVLSQHVHTAFKKHNLEKGETALMEGLRALTYSGLFLWANLPPTVKRCRKHLQAHAFTATVIHMMLKMHKFESYFIHVAKANSNWWTYDVENAQIWVIFCSCS